MSSWSGWKRTRSTSPTERWKRHLASWSSPKVNKVILQTQQRANEKDNRLPPVRYGNRRPHRRFLPVRGTEMRLRLRSRGNIPEPRRQALPLRLGARRPAVLGGRPRRMVGAGTHRPHGGIRSGTMARKEFRLAARRRSGEIRSRVRVFRRIAGGNRRAYVFRQTL